MEDAPDLTSHRAEHDAMRATCDGLLPALDGLRRDPRAAGRLASSAEAYAAAVERHCRIEERVVFPALATRVPAFGAYAATLEADHRELHTVAAALVGALSSLASGGASEPSWNDASRLAVRLGGILADHLDLEDGEVLPLFQRHFTAAEYRSLLGGG